MEQQTVRKFRWFWAWQDRQEEMWLESMAREGWHLKHVAFLNYTFEQGEPQNVVYCLDYRSGKDLAEYLEFIQGAGWEYIGRMSGWHYFRLPVEAGQTAEFYTDPESKIAKYQRIIGTLVATSPVFMIVFMHHLDRYPLWFAIFFVILFLLLLALYSVSLVKLAGRIKQLKHSSR
ncbi:MAG: DUF2812 domain-containing protein [Anaerolineae bacterium]|nr:DUF2812 domain-containing protein [Anaerolineae bacterium]